MRRVLPVYPWPMHQSVIDALAELDVDPVEALPGGPGPVLAIRKSPPFICDAIVVLELQRVAEAAHVVTSDGMMMVSMRDMVQKAFDGNGEVVEVNERMVGRVRFE